MGSDDISNVVGSEAESNTEEFNMQLLQWGLSFTSLLMGTLAVALAGGSGATGMVIGIAAVIFITIAAGKIDMYHPQSAKYGIMTFGLGLAGIGIVLSLIGLVQGGIGPQMIIPVIGIVTGSVAFFLGLNTLQGIGA